MGGLNREMNATNTKRDRNRKGKFGMQAKLLTFILPIVAVSFLVLIFMAFTKSKETITEKTESLMRTEGTAGAERIKAWESEILSVLDTAKETMLYLKMDDEEIIYYENSFLDVYEDFPNGIYITDENGKVLDATGWQPEGDARDSVWYTEGVTHESFAFGEPYTDPLTKEYIVTASCWADNLNGRGAVVSADVSLSILAEVVSRMEVAGDGDAFIVDGGSGMILAHKDEELVGTSVTENADVFYQNIYQDITAGNLTKHSYDSQDGAYMVACQNIEGTNWYIVSRGLEKNIYQDLEKLKWILTAFGAFMLLVVCGIMTILINRITKPIKKLTQTIVSVTEGDFTTDIDVKGNDEVTVMAGNMKEFIVAMREVLGSIVNISSQIDAQARNSNQVSGELYTSANGQAEAMGQMLENLSDLVRSITVIAENATTLAEVVAETNESGELAVGEIKTTIEAASEGKVSMRQVTSCMVEVKEGMEVLGGSIGEVGESAVKIDEITETIHSIAEETNLLSLNASIEAARAGEAGKGFAVVAMQIKKLAETSAEAAEEISGLIDSVTELIDDTVKRSERSMKQINDSAGAVEKAAEQFNRIFDSIEQTNQIVNSMIDKIHNVNDVASNMASITEEQSAAAEEIEATATNMRELADTVFENSAGMKEDSKELESTADTLKQHVSKFTI